MAILKTTAFVTDKKTALSEYYGVTKQGGYIGLGEITWQDKPSKTITDFTYDVMGGLQPESKPEWENLLRMNQLEVVVSKAEKLKKS